MTEQQTRPRNEPAERLRGFLSQMPNSLHIQQMLDAALREQTRITVEPFREAVDTATHPSRTDSEIVAMVRAALPRTPGEDRHE